MSTHLEKTEKIIFRFKKDYASNTETVLFITRTDSTAENVSAFQKFRKKIEFVHDRQSHGGLHTLYDKITVFIFIRKLNRHFQ